MYGGALYVLFAGVQKLRLFAIIRLFLQTRIADTALWFDENISAMESDSQNHYKPVNDVMEVTTFYTVVQTVKMTGLRQFQFQP